MTDNVMITLIICGTIFMIATMIVAAVTLGSTSHSNLPTTVDLWVMGRNERLKAQMAHEKVCPRTTDTPRKEMRV